MGVSTDGILCFGIWFDEGHTFPWDKKPYNGDHEEWWKDQCGFKPLFKLYDDTETGYANNKRPSDKEINKYYEHKSKFEEKHPPPFEVIFHCSDSYTMYILAVPGQEFTASRGEAVKINPAKLKVPEKKTKKLIDFCKKYKIRYSRKKTDPQWYLCSYWG